MMFPQISETFIVTKVLKLIDAGFDVQIFCTVESPHWDAFDVLHGRDDIRARLHVAPPTDSKFRALTVGSVFALRSAVTHPRSFTRLLKHSWSTRGETNSSFLASVYTRLGFVGQELDILHIEFDAQGIGIADLKTFFDCKLLCSARGTFQQLSVLEAMPNACRYLFRYVDGYHFISSFLDHNTHDLGLPNDVPTWHIEPAVDLALFTPVTRALGSASSVRIISVGRLSWEKGYELALDSVARARDAGIEVDYTIYGGGPHANAIEYAIRQLGLEGCARLGGVLRREDVPAAYDAADIMLHAAIAEGFCNAVIEAQAMELPVVTSDAGGLPENVADGVTGFVVRRRDPDAMAARIVELARDPELRRRFGCAGRVRALQRFDLDRQAKAFASLYQELAALPARAP